MNYQITDVIADMLTRIRNAGSAKHETVDIPASNVKLAIANILLEEGYIKGVEKIDDGKQGIIRITLKYTGKQEVCNIGYKENFKARSSRIRFKGRYAESSQRTRSCRYIDFKGHYDG